MNAAVALAPEKNDVIEHSVHQNILIQLIN